MKSKASDEAIGFDLGKTIYTRRDGVKVPFLGAYRVIKRIVDERFKQQSSIISRVTPEQKIRNQEMLKEDGFHELTGLPRDQVYWCTERHEKAPIARELKLTHFIDDRPEVLSHMEFVPHRFLFQPILEDIEPFKDRLQGVIILESWKEFEDHLF